MRDLIFLSLENWDEIWRRNQFVCAELARRFPERRILFVGKSLFMPEMARHARSGEGRSAIKSALVNRFWRVPEVPNIHVFNPIKPFPNPLPGGRACNETLIAAQIRRAARRAQIRDPLLWINPYESGHLIGQLGERGVVYDITDDWELAAETPEIKGRITKLDRDLCRNADLTMVCSQALFESRRKVASQLLLLPNGVDAAHYARIDLLTDSSTGRFDASGIFCPHNLIPSPDSDSKARADTARADTPLESREDALSDSSSWPRPVFGYTGTLHRERIDLDLVLQLARAHPGGSVVLIGPNFWTDGSLAQALESQPNLFVPGPVSYARIPEAMAHFDVCIVPHRRSEFVESLNPIKLWEYLACGKPIVATDVAGFRDFPALVRLSHDARGFIAACREALGEIGTPDGASLGAARRAEAAAHSWGSRVDALLLKWSELGLIEPETDSDLPGSEGEDLVQDVAT